MAKWTNSIKEDKTMKVFVKSNTNEPLMPTNPRKARILLKERKAEVVQRNPFTIRLLYPTGKNKQDITLGIDSGYLNIGFSAITQKEELITGEVQLLNRIIERNKERAAYRRTRRNRLWHRKPGFDVNTNKEGWFAPSIRHKIDSHSRFIKKLHEILPITKIIVEIANFDIQKIKNPDIEGVEYQQGEQKGYKNVIAYVLHRDGYTCQNPTCNNKDKQPLLQVHHIQFRKNGGSDRPDNLITLCNKCHTPENHKGFLLGWKPTLKGFKPETFMSIVRWKLVDILKESYSNVEHTYGYITKNKRFLLGIEKTHAYDAFCIADGTIQVRQEPFVIKQIRRNNRNLSKFYDAKFIDVRDGTKKSGSELNCGRTCRNKEKNGENLRKYRLKKISKGRLSIRDTRHQIQPMDLIEFDGQRYYVAGSQNKGQYIKLKNSKKVINATKVKVIKFGKGFCWIDNKIPC